MGTQSIAQLSYPKGFNMPRTVNFPHLSSISLKYVEKVCIMRLFCPILHYFWHIFAKMAYGNP